MKRILGLVMACLLCLSFASCARTYKGTDELRERARKEIPVADSDTIEIQFAGMCTAGDRAIAWFISGSEYQAHYYLPMEVTVKGDGYTFVRTYKPMTDICPDVAIVNWNGGYAFLVNNPEVAAVRLTLENGEVSEEVIPGDRIPYAFCVPSIPAEYVFIDAEGNEVQ